MLSVTRRIVNHTRKYPLVCYQAPGFNGTTAHFKGYRVTHSSRSFVTRKSVVSFRANLFWSYRHSPHYFQIRNIERNRSYTSEDACKTLVCSFVTSRLDYGNALLYGVNTQHNLEVTAFSKYSIDNS